MGLEELEALLDVQARDTALDQLRHRREALPERAQLEARVAEQRRAAVARDELDERRRAVAGEEHRLDDEARTVAAHAAEVSKRLYSGTTSAPRELQAMQADVEMLRRRQSDLEDEELELMEQREGLEREVAALDEQLASLAGAVEGLRGAIAASEAEIDAEAAVELEARAALAARVGEALLRDYERRRAQNRGAGAARLVGTTCQACHLTIPSTEAEQIRRAAGAVVAYCDNCSAILVP